MSRTSRSARRRGEAGFLLPMAIFLIVVMASLAAYMARTYAMMSAGFDMSLQGSLATQAALSGLEWGTYQAMDPNAAWQPGNALPSCPSTTTLTGLAAPLAGFSVTVSCSSGTYTEGNRLVAVYRFDSVATSGAAGTLDYVERRLQTTARLCKDPTAPSPTYPCS